METFETNRLNEENIFRDERSYRLWRIRKVRKRDDLIAEQSELRRDIITEARAMLDILSTAHVLREERPDLEQNVTQTLDIMELFRDVAQFLITGECRVQRKIDRLNRALACLNTSRNNNNF